jgi:hypothetical protein
MPAKFSRGISEEKLFVVEIILKSSKVQAR